MPMYRIINLRNQNRNWPRKWFTNKQLVPPFLKVFDVTDLEEIFMEVMQLYYCDDQKESRGQ